VVFSLIGRTPISLGLVRGYRRFGVPAACLLLWIWAGIIVSSTYFETHLNNSLNHIMTMGEGRRYAQSAHIPWPDRGP